MVTEDIKVVSSYEIMQLREKADSLTVKALNLIRVPSFKS